MLVHVMIAVVIYVRFVAKITCRSTVAERNDVSLLRNGIMVSASWFMHSTPSCEFSCQ